MPGASQIRLLIAQQVRRYAPESIMQNPQVEQALADYVDHGATEVTDDRLRKFINYLEKQAAQPRSEAEIESAVKRGVTRLAQLFAQDDPTRQVMTEFVEGIDRHTLNDEAAMQQYAQSQVMGFMRAQIGDSAQTQPYMDSLSAAFQTAGNFDDPDFLQRYYTEYVAQQYPQATPAERERLVAEHTAAMTAMTERDNGSFIPNGCMIPLIFLSLFVFLYGVMGLLLLLLAGQMLIPALFFETPVGRALNTTLVTMSLAGGLLYWLRQQVGLGGRLLRLALIAVFVLGGAALIFQLNASESDVVTRTLETDNEQLLAGALFVISIVSGVVVWVQRRLSSVFWLVIMFVLVISGGWLLLQTDMLDGLIDLDAIYEQLGNTIEETLNDTNEGADTSGGGFD